MSGVRNAVAEQSSSSSGGSRSRAPDGRPEGGQEMRWSARRKQEVVLRLLRGESLGRVGARDRPGRGDDRRVAGRVYCRWP